MARPTNQQKRKREAQELLQNGTLGELFEERKAGILDHWQAAETPDLRELLHSDIRALNDLKDFIYAAATDRSS